MIAIAVVLRLLPSLALSRRFLISLSEGLISNCNGLAPFYHRLFTDQGSLNHHVVEFKQSVGMQKNGLIGIVGGLSARCSGPGVKNRLHHVEYTIGNILVCLHRTP